MGNLLVAPVTEKETHLGVVIPGEIEYGLSSMQGWRVHMEDAHIAEPKLYAIEQISATSTSSPPNNDGNNQGQQQQYSKNIIPLPGHSIYAVFDGHGGQFAAKYSGRNACRVLSKEPKFVQYAKFVHEKLEKDKQLQQQQETAVAASSEAAATNSDAIPTKPDELEQQQQQKRAQYLRSGLDLLEGALRDAFVELDREIALAQRGAMHPDADQPYNEDEDDDMAAEDNTKDSKQKQQTDESSKDQQQQQNQEDSSTPDSERDSQNYDVPEADSGTTACIVLVTPDWIVCANAGDSRAVCAKNGSRAVPLSYDHKPDDEEEERRIRAAGGYVAGGRVEGDLAVSRGLGDFRFKSMATVSAGARNSYSGEDDDPLSSSTATTAATDGSSISTADSGDAAAEHNYNNYDHHNSHRGAAMAPGDQKVSPVPDIIVQTRNTEHDEFIILACDGIWDVRTNHECVAEIAAMFEEGERDLGLVCEELLDVCLRLGSKDNMTALIVKFKGQKINESGGGVTARRKLREESMNVEQEESDPSQSPQHQQQGEGGSEEYKSL